MLSQAIKSIMCAGSIMMHGNCILAYIVTNTSMQHASSDMQSLMYRVTHIRRIHLTKCIHVTLILLETLRGSIRQSTKAYLLADVACFPQMGLGRGVLSPDYSVDKDCLCMCILCV